jgi:hypothetical protein
LKTSCENCSKDFNPKKNPASKRAITVAAAGSGAAVGSSFGIAGNDERVVPAWANEFRYR